MKYFESKSGVIRRLLSLDTRDEVMLSNIRTDLNIAIKKGRSFLDLHKSMGSVKAKIDSRTYTRKNLVSLTGI